jgi:hypothetical protein
MATTKKKNSTKKTSTVKNAKATARPWTARFFVVSIGIFAIAVASVIVISLFAANVITTQLTKARFDRINDIYASLELDDAYVPQDVSIFGDKRVYDWDKSRSYSSAVNYLHADTVSNTATSLDNKIKAAGFEFIDEPYPDSTEIQYHYKSEKGEYVRLTVMSKPYLDAILNTGLMADSIPDSVFEMDKNAGPAKVVIKVNLDDNNE